MFCSPNLVLLPTQLDQVKHQTSTISQSMLKTKVDRTLTVSSYQESS